MEERNCKQCAHLEACSKWTDFPKQCGCPVCASFADVAPIVGHNDPIGEPGEDGLESSIRYAKTEVAREIFEEIYHKLDLFIRHRALNNTIANMLDFIEQVEKKYTEDSHGNKRTD